MGLPFERKTWMLWIFFFFVREQAPQGKPPGEITLGGSFWAVFLDEKCVSAAKLDAERARTFPKKISKL